MNRLFGVYAGEVVNNIDPMMLGRVQVKVPAMLGEGSLNWAMPCAPFAGDGVGFFTVPPVGANVWVAFEGGDPDRPIVLGGFWGPGELPEPTYLPMTKVWKTDCLTLKLDDLPGAGGLTIEVNPPAVVMPIKIAATASGLELSVGASKVVLNGVTVKINDGALEVL
ncbi:phage baseplate assembly protein V [Propioniciclava sinopodophylli]|uniref:phage baseplate assembly protein V n=1 Tax=Propioniciclava sinopodophylli TaxID=1837344 RepID=UPI002492B5B0|nr:phage baseplate assembly protein V [Propioniciclava sinopodophylli]